MKKLLSLLVVLSIVTSSLCVSYYAIDNDNENSIPVVSTTNDTNISDEVGTTTVSTTEPTTSGNISTPDEPIVEPTSESTTEPTTSSTEPTTEPSSTEPTEVKVSSIKLNATSKTLYNGKLTTLKATVNPENATNKSITWKSSNTKVATVDKNGKVSAIKFGKAIITVTSNDGSNVVAKCNITVVQRATKITLDKSIVNISKKGKTATVKATVYPSNAYIKSVNWKANNTKVATVDSRGKIKATTNKGTTYVNAFAKDGSKKSAKVLVIVGEKVKKIILNKTSVTLNRGAKNRGFQLKKSIKNKNATYKGVNWYSSNKKVATVDSKGKVTLKKRGEVTITVKAKDGSNKYAKCKITVKQLVTKLSYKGNKQAKEVVKGKTIKFSVSVIPSNANNKNLTYTSSNKKIATVDSKGKIKGIKAGTVTITAKAKDKSKKKVSIKVKVKNPPITDDTIIKSAKTFKNPKIVQRICDKFNNYFKSCGAKIEPRLKGTHQWYVADTSVAFNSYYGTSINEAFIETLGYWIQELSGDVLNRDFNSDIVEDGQWNGIRDWKTYDKFLESLNYKDKQGRERAVKKLVLDKKYNGFDWFVNKYSLTQLLVYVDYEKMQFRGKDYKDDDGNQEYTIKFYYNWQGNVDAVGWGALYD